MGCSSSSDGGDRGSGGEEVREPNVVNGVRQATERAEGDSNCTSSLYKSRLAKESSRKKIRTVPIESQQPNTRHTYPIDKRDHSGEWWSLLAPRAERGRRGGHPATSESIMVLRRTGSGGGGREKLEIGKFNSAV